MARTQKRGEYYYPNVGKWTYRLEAVRCGKGEEYGGACGTCPHGPYWYRYRHVRGRLEKEYVGKRAPWQAGYQERARPGSRGSERQRQAGYQERARPGSRGSERQREQYRQADPEEDTGRMRIDRALSVLGLDSAVSKADAKSRWRELALRHHPDRGGDTRTAQKINLAWDTLARWKGWR